MSGSDGGETFAPLFYFSLFSKFSTVEQWPTYFMYFCPKTMYPSHMYVSLEKWNPLLFKTDLQR